jgi:sec-independent protein translocase protein TatA
MHSIFNMLASTPCTSEPMLGWGLGMQELIVLGLFGLLVFGKRLPEVGKSLGKSIVEFKKGLSGIEDEINTAASRQDILPPPKTETGSDATKHAD